MSVRVIINGANGRMGQEAVKAVSNELELELVAETNRDDDLASVIKETSAQVVVDLTVPESVYANTLTIIENNAHPVIGTSGLTHQQIVELQEKSAAKKLGGIIVPNFSIGAVLMMQCASMIAKHLPYAEIIELHHENKLDAPSGTAFKTAQMIAENRKAAQPLPETQKDELGARGAEVDSVPIHSVRLPGLVAHQEVIFGGESETLSIRHDSLHRQSFMPGLCLACKTAPNLKQLHYGLENIL